MTHRRRRRAATLLLLLRTALLLSNGRTRVESFSLPPPDTATKKSRVARETADELNRKTGVEPASSANDAPAAATAPKAPADASADEVDAASDAAATRPVGGGFGANARARTHSMAGEPHESDLSMCPPQGSLSRPPFVCWTAREARSAQSRSMLCA